MNQCVIDLGPSPNYRRRIKDVREGLMIPLWQHCIWIRPLSDSFAAWDNAALNLQGIWNASSQCGTANTQLI